METNIATIAKAYLEKECGKLIIKLENAMQKPGVSEEELNALQRKIDINLYLQGRCE
jgi:hypothetical protein